jgi:hypothetical protein
MYYGINNGKKLVTERLRWVKYQKNGVFVICEDAEGQGVIIDNEIYHVDGRQPIDRPTISLDWQDDTKNLIDAIGAGAGVEQNQMGALVGVARLSKILLKQAIPELNPSDIFACEGLIDDWAPDDYAIDDVCVHIGQVWRCCQAHNSAVNNPDIIPGSQDSAAFWFPYHASSAFDARPWVKPTGAHDIYKSGEYMVWTDGVVYRCVSDTNYSPQEYAQAWETI